MRVAKKIELDTQTEHELRILSKRRRVERVCSGARVILLAAGLANGHRAVTLDRRQVACGGGALEGGIGRVADARAQDAPPVCPEISAHRQYDAAEATRPHRSTRTLARIGLSATTVRRVARDKAALSRPSSSRAILVLRTSCWTWWACT
jgi:hypothetical protein